MSTPGHALHSPSWTGMYAAGPPQASEAGNEAENEAGSEAGNEAENEPPREASNALRDVTAMTSRAHRLSRRRPQDGDAFHPARAHGGTDARLGTHAQLPPPARRFRE